MTALDFKICGISIWGPSEMQYKVGYILLGIGEAGDGDLMSNTAGECERASHFKSKYISS